MNDRDLGSFEQAMLPHLRAAYGLARWITGSGTDAEDVVQEAYLSAFRAFPQLRGGDAGAWLLAIVRNTAYGWMRDRRHRGNVVPFDEALHGAALEASRPGGAPAPDAALDSRQEQRRVRAAIRALPAEFRDVIVLRELEGMSYQEIAEALGVPPGTVMSRLSRARQRLRALLDPGQERSREL